MTHFAEFNPAVTALISREGGLACDANDLGGITKYGISFRFLKSVQPDAIEDDIINLTTEGAEALYKQYFWKDSGLDKFNCQIVANSVFDAMVNCGKAPAIKILQRACNSALQHHNALIDDGIMGAYTIQMVNSLSFVPLRAAIRSERAAYYRDIVARNPSQEVFLEGWLRRAYSV